jgi:hypothetical protein
LKIDGRSNPGDSVVGQEIDISGAGKPRRSDGKHKQEDGRHMAHVQSGFDIRKSRPRLSTGLDNLKDSLSPKGKRID